MRKTQLLSNKPVCLGWSELNNSKKILQKVYKENVETRLDTINFELDRSLPKGKSKKVIGSTTKRYSYLKDNNSEDRKAKGTKKCVIK